MRENPKQAILKALDDTDTPMTAAQIADACDRRKTTAFMRHLKELVRAGLVTVQAPQAAKNGRPAHLYCLPAATRRDNPKRAWRVWCQRNVPLDYMVWLEGVYSGEIDPDGRG